ncbi:unnamed protein product [Parnassius apollo]|uniref:(apollo) hypothetical protein n=1 Tax=Parnassius apollo TaxID=110799 RepID=A0A8S3X0S2_PARAO|nr:unnamed protein product [Parnassius apollo]
MKNQEDTDPSYVRQKMKKLPPKVIFNSSLSSSSDTSSSSTSNSSTSSNSSSDSETETRDIIDAVTQTQNQDIVNEGRKGHPSKNNKDQPDEDRNGQPNEDCNDQPNEDYNNQPYEEGKKGKKRLRREPTWKVNICKVLRNSGKAYALVHSASLVRLRRRARIIKHMKPLFASIV